MEKEVLISYSSHITENFKTKILPFSKVADLVKSKFNYSSGSFKDGYRKRDNYQDRSDVIILDIDDGLEISKAKRIFEPCTHIIATTKSHQKEKNGIVCDRFRVILQCENPIPLNSEDYNDLMQEIHKHFDFVDTSCKDSARFYYPSQDSVIQTYQGFCGFYWEDYWSMVLENRKHKSEVDRRKAKLKKAFGSERESELKFDETKKIDYIRDISKTERILTLLNFDEKFVAGQRNHYLYSIARYFVDLEMDNEEVRENVLWINAQGDSVPEDEITKTIFKSLRV